MQSDWIPWVTSTTVRSPWISGETCVRDLELQFAAASDVPFAIAVSSGKTALEMALLALEVGPGDEIIVPALGLTAAEDMARLSANAKLVLADIDSRTWCLEPGSVARLLTDRTRAVVSVDLYGNVAELDALKALAKDAGAHFIRVSAQMIFPRYDGHRATALTRVGVHTLQATRADPTGESGVLTTTDEELYERLRFLRDHGMLECGHQWQPTRQRLHMTNLGAAIACSELEKLAEIRSKRARVHRSYDKYLRGVEGFIEQAIPEGVMTTPWVRAGRVQGAPADYLTLAQQRDRLIRLMREKGVEIRSCFHSLCALASQERQDLQNARAVVASAILLPAYPSLADRTIERICDTLRQSLREMRL